MITDASKKVNEIIMQEIGLEVGQASKIYDQDTGSILKMNGADVVAQGCYRGRQTVEFDPFNDKRMMSKLFGYYLQKRSEEDLEDVSVLSFYDKIDKSDNTKGSIECRLSDGSTLISGNYIRDSLKYTDIIIQINGGSANSLQEYDSPIVHETVKKASSRGGTKNGKGKKKV